MTRDTERPDAPDTREGDDSVRSDAPDTRDSEGAADPRETRDSARSDEMTDGGVAVVGERDRPAAQATWTEERFGRGLRTLLGRGVVVGTLIATVVFLIGPVVFTFVASFATEWTGVLPTGFVTLDNWTQALGVTETVGARRGIGAGLFVSGVLALGGVAINLLVGIPVAYATVRYEFRGREWIGALSVLPIVPGLILGVAFLRSYPSVRAVLGQEGFTIGALLIGYSLLKSPYMVIAVRSSFESMDLRQLEESARSLGASWPRAFLTVIVPNAKRGIVAGSIVCWTLAAAEFNFTYNVYSRGPRPFSLFLFENISNNPFLRAAAAVSIYFLIVACVTALLRAVGEHGFAIGGDR